VTIEAGAVIADDVQLDAGVFVGRGTAIGAARLYPNAAVYHGCKIGRARSFMRAR
jgi:UDP-3-O-[3-hydroxymyristoyl] glucosamine N-acyltransferase